MFLNKKDQKGWEAAYLTNRKNVNSYHFLDGLQKNIAFYIDHGNDHKIHMWYEWSGDALKVSSGTVEVSGNDRSWDGERDFISLVLSVL